MKVIQWFFLAVGLFISNGVASAMILFQDNLNGGFDPAWIIIRPDTNYYTTNLTSLDLRCSHFDTDSYSPNQARNLFTITNPAAGDFTATLKLNSFVPVNNDFAQIDVIALDDEDNFVRVNYLSYAGQMSIELGKEVNANWGAQVTPHSFGSNSFFLRLTKIGTSYRSSYSTDGVNYTNINNSLTYGDGSPAWVGFVAGADPSEASHAIIDSFTVETIDVAVTNLTITTAVELSWPTVTTKTYQVQWASDLAPTNWINLGSFFRGTGTNFDLFDSTRGSDKKFYRVLQSQ